MPDSNTLSIRRTGPYFAMVVVLGLGALGLWMVLDPPGARVALGNAGAWSPVATQGLADAAGFATQAPEVAATMPLDQAAIVVVGSVALGVALIGVAWAWRGLRVGASLRALRPYTERVQELGAAVALTNDSTALEEILSELMKAQQDAETLWLAGRIASEHLSVLNQAFDTRSRSVAEKIQHLHLQALIEGGPSPAMYHPEPARPIYGATSVAAPAPAPRALDVPQPVVPAKAAEDAYEEPAIFRTPATAPAPVAVAKATAPQPSVAPQATGDVGEPRVRHKKKDRGRHGQQPGRSGHEPAPVTPRDTPAVAAMPQGSALVPRPAAVAPSGVSAPRPLSAARPPQPAPAPRKLEDWEIEQKYQRSSDEASDFDSGIVSPPRPRRVQAPGEGAVPARAALNGEVPASDMGESEAEAERRRSQLDLF